MLYVNSISNVAIYLYADKQQYLLLVMLAVTAVWRCTQYYPWYTVSILQAYISSMSVSYMLTIYST